MKKIKVNRNLNLIKEEQFVRKNSIVEVTNDRADEIVEKGFAEFIEEDKKTTSKAKTKKEEVKDIEVEELTEEVKDTGETKGGE